jgi:hypothetical protein
MHYSPEWQWNENKEFPLSLLRGTHKLCGWGGATAHPTVEKCGLYADLQLNSSGLEPMAIFYVVIFRSF